VAFEVHVSGNAPDQEHNSLLLSAFSDFVHKLQKIEGVFLTGSAHSVDPTGSVHKTVDEVVGTSVGATTLEPPQTAAESGSTGKSKA
jgi:activator of 2-hydroxyglutaryl-CoA dehydratase